MLILIFNQEIFLCTSSSKVNASHHSGGHLDLKNRTEKASSPARPALFVPLTEYNFRKAVCGHANLLGPLIITGGKENYQLFSNCTLVMCQGRWVLWAGLFTLLPLLSTRTHDSSTQSSYELER